jgi:hypothetical protein
MNTQRASKNKTKQQQKQQRYEEVRLLFKYSIITIILCPHVFFHIFLLFALLALLFAKE